MAQKLSVLLLRPLRQVKRPFRISEMSNFGARANCPKSKCSKTKMSENQNALKLKCPKTNKSENQNVRKLVLDFCRFGYECSGHFSFTKFGFGHFVFRTFCFSDILPSRPNFARQWRQIKRSLQIKPGWPDWANFRLFGRLFTSGTSFEIYRSSLNFRADFFHGTS
jgi:hypothetical protein